MLNDVGRLSFLYFPWDLWKGGLQNSYLKLNHHKTQKGVMFKQTPHSFQKAQWPVWPLRRRQSQNTLEKFDEVLGKW